MAETFSLSELVIPGTAIRVRADGLIGAGAISSGNIGIVGSALREQIQLDADGNPVLDADGNPEIVVDGGGNPVFDDIYGETKSLSDYDSAVRELGPYDALTTGQRQLVRSIELLFRNGARQVYAQAVDPRSCQSPQASRKRCPCPGVGGSCLDGRDGKGSGVWRRAHCAKRTALLQSPPC